MEYMLMPLKRYADFSGRSRRKEYWMFSLFMFLVMIVMLGLAIAIGGFMGDGAPNILGSILIGILGLFALAVIIPSIAVQVRRFHDQDKSGWFFLLNFIPYIGGLVVFVFMCLDGTPGPNRFGPDPKGRGGSDLEETFR